MFVKGGGGFCFKNKSDELKKESEIMTGVGVDLKKKTNLSAKSESAPQDWQNLSASPGNGKIWVPPKTSTTTQYF